MNGISNNLVKETKKRKRNKIFQKHIEPYLFLFPYLLFFAVFALLPVILSIVISFFEWDITGDVKWVALENYKLIFSTTSLLGEKFWTALSHTLLYVGIQAPILIVVPLIVAVILNSKVKGTGLFRVMIYFPAIFSVSTVATIFYILLDTNIGIFNIIFGSDTPWLTKQPWQWISIFMMSTWWGIGGNMILYTAGLQGISKDIYEAATIDGCNKLQKFIYITIPSLANTLVYVIIMTILSCFNVMGQPMLLTPGEESTTVAIQYIYDVAFGGNKFGRGCAMSLVMAVIMAGFSYIAFKLIIRKGEVNNGKRH